MVYADLRSANTFCDIGILLFLGGGGGQGGWRESGLNLPWGGRRMQGGSPGVEADHSIEYRYVTCL